VGNRARGAEPKSLLEVIDQLREDVSILFFDNRPAPKGTNVFDIAARLRDGDLSLMLVDPAVNQLAALRQQTNEVLGLSVIRRALRS
jgi:hypothetical protein